MARIYKQAYAGEWFPVKRKDQAIECCDCCLVHLVSFRIRKGKLEMKAVLDKRATAQRRRRAGIEITQRRAPKRKSDE